MTEPPLPFRDGLAPLRIRLPHPRRDGTLVEYLEQHHPGDRWAEMITAGTVVDEKGRPWHPESAYAAGRFVIFHRTPAPEVPVPFELEILHADDDLIVVHKPHFLATIPRGRHVTETATVRLRRQFDDPTVTPAHRLDRSTAGVLLFTRGQRLRRPYQELFATRAVRKEYLAIADVDASLTFPRVVRSRIVKEHGVMTAREEPGEPNSETRIDLVDASGTRGLYRLHPITGKTHQLRIHLASLGIPIHGDPYYPNYTSTPAGDFSTPLQLLAASLEFVDPLSGVERRFVSPVRLHL